MKNEINRCKTYTKIINNKLLIIINKKTENNNEMIKINKH